MTAADDLTGLYLPPPAGPSQPMTYRQGVIRAWNPVTLQNTVAVAGTELVDLPVLGVAEAASFTPGAKVGIMKVGETWAIIGRFVTPATSDATDAVTLVSQGIVTGFLATTENCTSDTFGDLATVGPTATINVRAGGKVLLFLGATIGFSAGAGFWGGFMNFAASGANTIAAGTPGGLGYSTSGDNEWSIARMMPLEGLTPGPTTFVAKYANLAAGQTTQWRNRSIAAFAL